MDLSGEAAGLIAIGLLFAFMLASIPVFVAMGLAAFIGFVLTGEAGQALRSFAQIVWQSSSIFELVAIPLFIFAGLLSEQISAGRDLFDVAKAWVGRVPNALGVATILACGVFAAISGSSIATAASIGVVSIPLLLGERYSKSQAGGFVAAGGTLGILIPPSIPFILYGVITETSIGQLFMAGIVPGVLMMSLFAVWVMLSRPRIVEERAADWSEPVGLAPVRDRRRKRVTTQVAYAGKRNQRELTKRADFQREKLSAPSGWFRSHYPPAASRS